MRVGTLTVAVAEFIGATDWIVAVDTRKEVMHAGTSSAQPHEPSISTVMEILVAILHEDSP
jgi:hypothetical protein